MDQASAVHQKPEYRAVYRNGSLTLVSHAPWMPADFGFARHAIQTSPAVLADFEIFHGVDGLELIVTMLNGPGKDSFRDAVIRFAKPLGYSRIWLESEVIDLAPDDTLGPTEVTTTCPGCGTRFTERQPTFILNARASGTWPVRCPIDGTPLPQWAYRDIGDDH